MNIFFPYIVIQVYCKPQKDNDARNFWYNLFSFIRFIHNRTGLYPMYWTLNNINVIFK